MVPRCQVGEPTAPNGARVSASTFASSTGTLATVRSGSDDRRSSRAETGIRCARRSGVLSSSPRPCRPTRPLRSPARLDFRTLPVTVIAAPERGRPATSEIRAEPRWSVAHSARPTPRAHWSKQANQSDLIFRHQEGPPLTTPRSRNIIDSGHWLDSPHLRWRVTQAPCNRQPSVIGGPLWKVHCGVLNVKYPYLLVSRVHLKPRSDRPDHRLMQLVSSSTANDKYREIAAGLPARRVWISPYLCGPNHFSQATFTLFCALFNPATVSQKPMKRLNSKRPDVGRQKRIMIRAARILIQPEYTNIQCRRTDINHQV